MFVQYLIVFTISSPGDFDVTWRANRKNYQILDEHLEHTLQPQQPTKPTVERVAHVAWPLLLGILSAVGLFLLINELFSFHGTIGPIPSIWNQ